MTQKIQEIYNRLHNFESKSKKTKGENRLYPVHKKLLFSEEKYTDISDWIIENLKIKETDHVLDAGCGVGYVLTKICNNFNCSGLGISLSEKEIEYATKISVDTGKKKRLSFQQKSFDDKFDDKFDVIIAIESIKHSDSIQETIENFAAHLNPGGRIFILDDFATNTRFRFLKKQVQKYWAVDSFYTLNSVEKKLNELKLPCEIVNFTPNVTYSKKRFTAAKLVLLFPVLFLAKLFPVFKIYSIYVAGFCLERLYKKQALEYKAIIATKPVS